MGLRLDDLQAMMQVSTPQHMARSGCACQLLECTCVLCARAHTLPEAPGRRARCTSKRAAINHQRGSRLHQRGTRFCTSRPPQNPCSCINGAVIFVLRCVSREACLCFTTALEPVGTEGAPRACRGKARRRARVDMKRTRAKTNRLRALNRR